MLNNNGRNAIAYMMYSSTSTATAVQKMKNSEGVAGTTTQTFSTTMNTVSLAKDLSDLTTSGNGVSLFVSSDSSQPLDDAYTVSAINDLTIVSGMDKITKGSTDSTVLYSVIRAFKNETNEPKTVNSVCLMVHNNTKENFLIYRELLESPIVIQPQDTKIFGIMLK